MFECRALGANELKGLPQPVEAWQVRGETASVSRFEARRAGALSPLVGRQEEIDLLLRRWDQAKLGEGRVVLLSGEPSIGKSRIAETLLVRLEGEPYTRLRHFCSPHHMHSPLYPFIAQIERTASFDQNSSANARLDKLEALLKPTSRNVRTGILPRADCRGGGLGPYGPQRGARAADGLRPHLPARNAAGRDLLVQARAGTGRRGASTNA